MMVRHLLATSLLVGLALVTLLGRCEAVRRPPQRHDITHVTPSAPTITDGGWRPVIDSRSSYEPSPHEEGDHTIDLVPPPVGGIKTPTRVIKPSGRKPEAHIHKHEPHFHKHEAHVHSHDPHIHKHEPHHIHKHEPHVHKPKGTNSDLKGSETRGPVTPSDGPTGPSRPMRFPDQKVRSPTSSRPRRPTMAHHHHHHHHHPHPEQQQQQQQQQAQSASEQHPSFNVRPTAFVGSESTQQLRFRPSPQVPAAYENPYPGWLVQQEELQAQQQQQQQQQQQVFYNNPTIDPSSGLLQLQQSYTSPIAQYQLAIAQQQPEIAGQLQQQQQADLAAQYKQPQQAVPTVPAQNAFIPGTATVFGNAGLFNINPDLQKDQRQAGNLFLSPSVTEPSVHENEVPQGPQVFVSHTTRSRPQRPVNFDSNIDILKLPSDPTVPTFQQQENSDFRPRRPRPPTGIQAQLEGTRRPILEENAHATKAKENANEDAGQFKPLRHPRPPSTEPPSWSHPALDSSRIRKPRPPQQNDEAPNTRVRRPRPPVQEQSIDSEQQEVRPRRPVRPAVSEQDWKPSTPLPEPPQHLRPQEESDAPVRPRRPRPPPPVQEHVEDDVERPVFNLRPRRPIPTQETEPAEEEVTQRPRRPRPPPVDQENPQSPQEEQPAQEDVDDAVNVRPRRPRPPEDEERPRIRRPKPPTDVSVRRRRPRPPLEEQEHRRPVFQPTDNQENEEPARLRPVVNRGRLEEANQEYAVVEPQESQEEVAQEPEIILEEEPTAETLPEAAPVSTTTSTTHAPLPTFPSKRRRPVKIEQPEILGDSTENYPPQFTRVTTEAVTTPAPTTTNPPTTIRSLINSRLRARLNVTRPRFGLGVKERLNRLSALKKTDDETTTTSPIAEEPVRTRQRTRDSSRFRVTTEQPEVERTSFKPSFNRVRPVNKFSSRYRPTTEEPATTTSSQDATRRASEDIYTIKERKPFSGIKIRTPEKETKENDVPVTSVSFSVSEVTTVLPSTSEEITTVIPVVEGDEDTYETTEEPNTTSYPEEPAPTTPAEDFSVARRVTDLTSSATAFKPLSFFSAVPADGKSRSQLSSRFTMATEDPILPLEAFFPTFPSKSSKEVGEHNE